MKKIDIYTDGACKGNPGPGGFAAILVYNGVEKTVSGGEKDTTNNRMELSAVVYALEALKEPCEINLYSDSEYFINAMTKGWLRSWISKGWVKSDRKPVLNRDLWERIVFLTSRHSITYIWVKGHAGHEYNERCDRIAVFEAEKLMQAH